jgi:hypothetical protein
MARPSLSRIATCCLCLVALVVVFPANALARAYWVSPRGSDGHSGKRSAPFRTIGKGVAAARRGDTVMVASGVYGETVHITSKSAGISLRGHGRRRPLIDGGGTEEFGILLNTLQAPDVSIARFEIAHQVKAGIFAIGSNLRIIGNVIHDVGSPEVVVSDGIVLAQAQHALVKNNYVHSIGPGGESDGIRLTNSRDSTVSDNVIQTARKEGIRDWTGLNNDFRRNAISLCAVGIAFNTSMGGLAAHNYLHDNSIGLNPKHTSAPSVLAYWHRKRPRWSRFHRNTVYRSSDASIWLAGNDPEADFIDVRNNVFSGAGNFFIGDAPTARGSHLVVDGNVYSRRGGAPTDVYRIGFRSDGLSFSTLHQLRSRMGWEKTGLMEADPAARWRATPRAARFRSGRNGAGRRVGARHAAREPNVWRPWHMRPVRSTSVGTHSTDAHLKDSSDARQRTYWTTTSAANESVTYDLGTERPINLAVLDVFSQYDNRGIHGYRLEVSGDGHGYRTVASGTNPDDQANSHKYRFHTVHARFVRFTLVDTFCASYTPRTDCGLYFIMSDLRVGHLKRLRPKSRRLKTLSTVSYRGVA